MKSVNWSAYAKQYDLMAQNNPAYQELVQRYKAFLTGCPASTIRRVVDAGAGTGNFSMLTAEQLPSAKVIHLEPDAGMNSRVRLKAQDLRLTNLIIDERTLEAAQFPAGRFDLVISVHALYTIPEAQKQLRKIASWLRPGGQAFLCDFGRMMDVEDWRSFLFRNLRQRLGLLATLKIFWQGREVAQQNRNVAALQRSGQYWLHTPEQFRNAVEEAGFEVLNQELAYRGCSDLIVGQRN